jgi:hypothetical protein
MRTGRWPTFTQAVVLVPREVEIEIEIDNARECYMGVPLSHEVPWASRIFLTEDEQWTATQVKVALGGGSKEHLGECAVIACAYHRCLVAILDDRADAPEPDSGCHKRRVFRSGG